MGASSGASAPAAAHIEPEPREWQLRATWVGARLLCGAAAFFFLAFVFAYFYLRSLDVNKDWKIGAVHPSIGLGVIIAVTLVLSAALLRLATRRPDNTIALGLASLTLALLAVVLQVVEWTTLGFGPASGGYASVFIGWTALYAVFALVSAYWIETQIATAWRHQREGVRQRRHEGVVGDDRELFSAALEACSFFWAFYVAAGVLAFVILYVV
jgi:heme/copper-type cytochrome/quinol oxidase subunit 3